MKMSKFLVTIGDTKVELEGKTRDDAIKRVGLNPEHWQANKGENMEIKKATGVGEKQSTIANSSKKRTVLPLTVEAKPVNRHRKPNITTDDIGKWFTDGMDVWKLDIFIPEPQISMTKVASMGGDPQKHQIKKGSPSDFHDFRRLIPEPEPRKQIKKQG
jgi:hypothetical protein